jgi:hypothetical protein
MLPFGQQKQHADIRHMELSLHVEDITRQNRRKHAKSKPIGGTQLETKVHKYLFKIAPNGF